MTVNYELNETVATITLDDGKVNVLGPAMQTAINQALDRAEKEDAKAVVLAGNHRACQRRVRPVRLPVRRRAGGAGHARGRLRAVGAVPDVPEAGQHEPRWVPRSRSARSCC